MASQAGLLTVYEHGLELVQSTLGASVTDNFVLVKLGFKVGSLSPAEIQDILDKINKDLADPNSEASQEAARIGVSAKSLEVQEEPAFAVEAFLIAMAIKFAGGAATAGGALFFDRVIKPKITGKKADGIGEPIPPDERGRDSGA